MEKGGGGVSKARNVGGNSLERQARTNLCPYDDAGLQNHLWLGAKVLGLPQDQVGERADSDLSDEMADTVCDGAGHAHIESTSTRKDGDPCRECLCWRQVTYGLMVYLEM